MAYPDFEKQNGLVPVIAQDSSTGDVLMLAYMNRQAYERTITTGFAHYYSRERRRLWKKGEESGNVQQVIEMRIDCDADALLLKVTQTGAACHEGYRSCFFRRLTDGEFAVADQRIADPKQLYGDKTK